MIGTELNAAATPMGSSVPNACSIVLGLTISSSA